MGARPHGHFLAGEVGELAGVSGTTIGQWARRGYIRSSQSEGDPRVYAVEDVLEAALVRELLARGVGHGPLHAVVDALRADARAAHARAAGAGAGGGSGSAWPLSDTRLATTETLGRPRIVVLDDDGCAVLSPRGWQRLTAPPDLRDVRARLQRTPAEPRDGLDARPAFAPHGAE